jgi:hypothetical protein
LLFKSWQTHGTMTAKQKTRQIARYRSGEALQVHIDSAHGGVVDPKCPGCKEILAKQEKYAKVEK